jgi:hypothetical protein
VLINFKPPGTRLICPIIPGFENIIGRSIYRTRYVCCNQKKIINREITEKILELISKDEMSMMPHVTPLSSSYSPSTTTFHALLFSVPSSSAPAPCWLIYPAVLRNITSVSLRIATIAQRKRQGVGWGTPQTLQVVDVIMLLR